MALHHPMTAFDRATTAVPITDPDRPIRKWPLPVRVGFALTFCGGFWAAVILNLTKGSL